MDILNIKDKNIIEITDLKRKLTIGGVSKSYPVYKVRLDYLFYNDQNDRISTWLSQYNSNESNEKLADLDRNKYNEIIEGFIVASNPDAINKTKNNIELVGQREPGVILSDGRVIDGNRRFTCLRILNRENHNFNYFETIILDDKSSISKKEIKLLELSIQHGEEQRVDYNLIDFAIGTYQDIMESKLLTIQEYASGTGESTSDVYKRLEIARLIIEFLDYMNVPKQYHIAREMQVYSVFFEAQPMLKKINDEETRENLKKSIFANLMFNSFDDHRKYIRDLKSLCNNKIFFSLYLDDQKKLFKNIDSVKEKNTINNKNDLDKIIKNELDIKEELTYSLEKQLSNNKKSIVLNKPIDNINKSISLITDIDTKLVENFSDEEKKSFIAKVRKLAYSFDDLLEGVDGGESIIVKRKTADVNTTSVGRQYIAKRHLNEPFVFCSNTSFLINNLLFPVKFNSKSYLKDQENETLITAYFVDEDYNLISDKKTVSLEAEKEKTEYFNLFSAASSLKKCYLVIKSKEDAENECQNMIEFGIKIEFTADFGI